MHYHNRKFRLVSNSQNGELEDNMIFHYLQDGVILTCTYSGLNIKKGHLIGIVKEDGEIEMSYHQINTKDEMMTGVCRSSPTILDNGKIQLNEEWQWTSGDLSKGRSVLIEI